MRTRITYLLTALLAIGLLMTATPASGQFGKWKKKAQKKIEKRTDEKVDKAMDDALDAAEGKGESASESSSEESRPASGTSDAAPASASPASGKTAPAGSDAPAASLKPGEGAWANYDFIPGDEVLYFEDFEKCPVGDFPERLEFVSGNMETIEWQGSRYLRMPTHSDFNIPLPGVLPDRFTIEFDLYLPGGVFRIYGQSEGEQYGDHTYLEIRHGKGRVQGGAGGKTETKLETSLFDDIIHCRLMGYRKYFKVYVNDRRIANIPNADFVHSDKLGVNLYNFSGDGVLIDNIRVAKGGKKILYDALMADGRVATRGIYFDSGSDNLRPESTPTLKQMGEMLQEHADLQLLIEGHTDNVGDEQYNLDLSKRRAAAVREFLISNYGIDGSRLQAKGLGESKPVSPNSTPEGRQNNRRVELVKL